MNVYDFDGTIYRGDSSIDFYLFVLCRKPIVLTALPGQVFAAIAYQCKKISKLEWKQRFFSFLQKLEDPEEWVDAFWRTHADRIFPWYLSQKQPDDVIISASPEFLLLPICQQLGIGTVIASLVDIHTGVFHSQNCLGEEKVTRLREQMGQCTVDAFYSDSKSDLPMAKIAKSAFLVKSGNISHWDCQSSSENEA